MVMRLLLAVLVALAGTAPARAPAEQPEQVLRQYFALLARHNYPAAYRLQEFDVSLRRFVARFRPYLTYEGRIVGAGQGDTAMGSAYQEIPVEVHGRLRNGRPFSERGTVTLRANNHARVRRWAIYSADIPPRFGD